jgi:hypothetical protein
MKRFIQTEFILLLKESSKKTFTYPFWKKPMTNLPTGCLRKALELRTG